jgi:hypothetical protein
LAYEKGYYHIAVSDGERTRRYGPSCPTLDRLAALLDEYEAEKVLPKHILDDLNVDLTLLRQEAEHS